MNVCAFFVKTEKGICAEIWCCPDLKKPLQRARQTETISSVSSLTRFVRLAVLAVEVGVVAADEPPASVAVEPRAVAAARRVVVHVPRRERGAVVVAQRVSCE